MWHPWIGSAPINIPFFIWWSFGVDCYMCKHNCRNFDEFMEHSIKHSQEEINAYLEGVRLKKIKHGESEMMANAYVSDLRVRSNAKIAELMAKITAL